MISKRSVTKSKSIAPGSDIKKRLKKLGAEWQLDAHEKKLSATYTFKRYLDAFMFVTRIAVHAEVQKQYPEITLTSNKVKVTLSDTVAKHITASDIEFATLITRLSLSTTPPTTT